MSLVQSLKGSSADEMGQMAVELAGTTDLPSQATSACPLSRNGLHFARVSNGGNANGL